MYPLQKFHHDAITLFRFAPSLPNVRKCASSDSASFLVILSAYSQDPCTDVYAQYVEWRLVAQGCAFWGLENTILYLDPILTTKCLWKMYLDTLSNIVQIMYWKNKIQQSVCVYNKIGQHAYKSLYKYTQKFEPVRPNF